MLLFDKIKSEYFCRAKTQKEKHNSKNSINYTEKNLGFVDVFLEKVFNLVLKFTRLSFAMLFAKSNLLY